MPNITKQQAYDAAKSVCAKELKVINDLKAIIDEKKEKLWISYIPAEVLKFFKKYPDYFCTRSSINVNNSFHISLKGSKNLPSDKWTITIDPKETAEIEKLIQREEKLAATYKGHIITIENTLINLKTYKKIEESLPEIAAFLPKGVVTTSLVVPVKEVKEILKMIK